MTVLAPAGAPSIRDAERAADALADAGVPVVLLHGSVARGDQHADSDIDLVAVLDDLVVVAHAFASAAAALGNLAAQHIAEAAPTTTDTRPAAGAPDWEAARTARLCAAIESVLANWDLSRDTPTAKMGIPAPPG